MHQLKILFVFLFFGSTASYSQLSAFTLNVAVTDETCTNNGAIGVTVSNAVANSEITYQLYLAPEFDIFIAQTVGPSFSSLSAGNYRVVATQTLNGESSSKQIDLIIISLIEVLDFELENSTASNCDTTATLIVNILSGNPTFFEIIDGPEIRPLQVSNVFTGLSSGTYIIRVYDECGDALAKSYTFVLANNNLNIGAPQLPEIYTSCTSVQLTNQITSNTSAPILYPLLINYTIFAPNGAVAQLLSQNIATGPTDLLELLQDVNLFGNQLFNIQIEVIDNCNNVFIENFEINPNPKLNFQQQVAPCGALFFAITVVNFFPPYTLNFTEPAEFNPLTFNAGYPGPFTTSEVIFGNLQNTVPFGNYKLSAIDGCGKTANLDFSLSDQPLRPNVHVFNNGCESLFGTVRIQVPGSRQIVSISMILAPTAYPNPLPHNVMSSVNTTGIFFNNNLPVGNYSFLITDNCGDSYTVLVTVPVFVFGNLVAITRPSCGAIFGAVSLSTTNGALVIVTITAAPSTFTELLPFDVSLNISANGIFYMSDLPAGTYSFTAKDICGFDLATTVQIMGYTSSSLGFLINRKCGAFDIIMNDTDDSITGKSFWLQRFFPNTNTWGHPNTAAGYAEGTIPNSTNSQQLSNPNTLLNIFLIGNFRIIKVFESFANGNPIAQCTDLYAEFTVAPDLLISGFYNLSCNDGNGPDDVVVEVVGVAPFNFSITSPVVLNNGQSNVFSNLPEGLYNFRVTDNCGNLRNISVGTGSLIPLTIANAPQSMLVCRNDGVAFGIFPLVNQKAQILGSQNPNMYNVSFHLSQDDAESGQNPLPDGYTNITNPQIIFARVQHMTIALCYATTSFSIFAGITPILVPADPVILCAGFNKLLTADAGFPAYEWSTGETTRSILVSEPGIYTVTVKNIYQDFSCDATKEFVVNGSSPATFQAISTTDWSEANNSVVILVTGAGTYQYSLDDVIYQTSNTFADLRPGIYTVYVRDENGCGKVNDEFTLLNYPKFFTPNADGYNDTWQIQFSTAEPDLNVDVFDRFGKFIIRIKGGEVGWDGTYNGSELPATDYWFVVVREDGKIYKGHFSLKR
jgi:gliding motility-associated-like protein